MRRTYIVNHTYCPYKSPRWVLKTRWVFFSPNVPKRQVFWKNLGKGEPTGYHEVTGSGAILGPRGDDTPLHLAD